MDQVTFSSAVQLFFNIVALLFTICGVMICLLVLVSSIFPKKTGLPLDPGKDEDLVRLIAQIERANSEAELDQCGSCAISFFKKFKHTGDMKQDIDLIHQYVMKKETQIMSRKAACN